MPLGIAIFSNCVSFPADPSAATEYRRETGYRLIIDDQAGVMVSAFQLTETALAQPEAFVEALRQVIEDVEGEEGF